MLHSLEDSQLPQAAMAEASLTHRNPLDGDVAAAVISLCRALIHGMEWFLALAMVQAGRMEETRIAISRRRHETPVHGGFAPDILASAIHFLDKSNLFSQALETSITFAGPENYCPVLVGSIGGARWGRSAVPNILLDHCNISERVMDLAELLAASWLCDGKEIER